MAEMKIYCIWIHYGMGETIERPMPDSYCLTPEPIQQWLDKACKPIEEKPGRYARLRPDGAWLTIVSLKEIQVNESLPS
jgi:hypothetical protein